MDKFPYQTRRLALALPLRGLCLPAALARSSSIWSTWSAPRIATLPMCTPCVRAPAHISIRVPGVRAGGGDVEAQSDRTSRPSPLEARQRPMGLSGPDPPIRPYPCVSCVCVVCMFCVCPLHGLPVYTCQSGRVWSCLLWLYTVWIQPWHCQERERERRENTRTPRWLRRRPHSVGRR